MFIENEREVKKMAAILKYIAELILNTGYILWR